MYYLGELNVTEITTIKRYLTEAFASLVITTNSVILVQTYSLEISDFQNSKEATK